MAVSSGWIHRSKLDRFTGPSISTDPPLKLNTASSAPDSASFSRETDW